MDGPARWPVIASSFVPSRVWNERDQIVRPSRSFSVAVAGWARSERKDAWIVPFEKKIPRPPAPTAVRARRDVAPQGSGRGRLPSHLGCDIGGAVALQGAESAEVSTDQKKWATLSGSTPTYSMTANGTLYARSHLGSAISAVDSVTVKLYPSAPKFDTVGGAYLAPQQVSLSTVPTGASIHYTTDGSTPTTSSPTYTKPISIGSSTTLKAIAANGAAVNGTVGSATYAIADTNTFGIPWNQSMKYGTLWDTRDNRVYRTVKIGSQTWMAQNLNYKVDSSWCYENSADSCAKYGRVYHWSAAMDVSPAYDSTLLNASLPRQGICPNGWHVPSDDEWSKLTDTILSPSTAATVLESTSGWAYNTGTDAYGFRALPGGFSNFGEGGTAYDYFWSATEHDASEAGLRQIYFLSGSMSFGPESKTNGDSLRCLEN